MAALGRRVSIIGSLPEMGCLLGTAAGDGGKRVADKEVLLLAELAELVGALGLVQSSLLLDQLVLKPGVVGGKSSAVTDMAGSQTSQLSLVLHRLGIGDGALDLLRLILAANGSLDSPRGGVGDEVLALRGLLDIAEEAAVGLNLNVIGSKMLTDRLVHLGLFNIERGLVEGNGGVAVEDRVEVDVVSSQVEEPSDFIQSGDVQARRLLLGDLLADLSELVLDGLASVLLGVNKRLVRRHPGTLIAPDLIDQVLGNGDKTGTAGLLDGVGKLLSRGGRDESRVDTGRLAVFALLGNPFLPGDLLWDAKLDQSPVLIQLLCGLVEVSSIGRKSGGTLADHCVSSRSVEACDEFSAVEAGCRVLRGVAVTGGYDYAMVSVWVRRSGWTSISL